MKKITGIVLAGGQNTRMGCDKSFLEVGGRRMIENILATMEMIFEEIIIVTNRPLNYLSYDQAIIVADLIPKVGALGGLYTGLFYATFEHAFVCACDMPFLNKNFIFYMIDKIADYEIVIPKSADGFQPLHAIYSKKCLSSIRKNIEEKKVKIINIFKRHRTLILGEEVINNYPDASIMFLNINTPEEYQRVQSITKQGTKCQESTIL